jgi:hypothetical protein
MPARRRSKAFHLQAAELAVAAPQVVAHRVGRMLAAGLQPSAQDRAEMHRMGAEKVAAFYESWNAMAAEAMRLQLEQSMAALRMLWWPWGAASRPTTQRQLQQAAMKVLAAGMTPVHRRAAANAKRLARTKQQPSRPKNKR